MSDSPAPAPDPSPPDAELPPPPRGIGGHLAYTWTALRRLRAWRRELETLDARLRDAVATRDEALAGLGQATLAGGSAERRAGDRIAVFADTLAALDAERATIDGRRETLTIELAAAEADRRARLADFDGRRDALDAETAATERALAAHRRELAELDRLDADDAALRRNLEGRRSHIADPAVLEAIDDAERAVFAEEAPTIDARLAELDAAEAPRATRRAALTGPIAHLEAQLADITRRRRELRTERASLIESSDARIAELRANRDEEVELLTRLDERRRAALVDLGREALHHDGGADRAASEARASLDAITTLRRERTALNTRRAALDEGPIRRTALGLGLLFVVLLVLRAVLSGP